MTGTSFWGHEGLAGLIGECLGGDATAASRILTEGAWGGAGGAGGCR